MRIYKNRIPEILPKCGSIKIMQIYADQLRSILNWKKIDLHWTAKIFIDRQKDQ